jgi:hypothetical protein
MQDADRDSEAWLTSQRRRRRIRLGAAAGGAVVLIAMVVALLAWQDAAPAREAVADEDHVQRACDLLARCGVPPDKVTSLRDLLHGPPSGRFRHALADMAATIVERCGALSCEKIQECVLGIASRADLK